jgi:tetratricopeptide (TPR) repeat protein
VKGFLAIENGKLDDARQFANDILAQNQEDEGGAILMARLQALNGNFESAIDAVRSASQAIGETEALNATLLEIYRAQGNAGGMATTLPKVIESAGKASRYHLDYINLLFKTGNRTKALAEAIEAIEASPNDRNTLASLTQLFLDYEREPLTVSQRKEMAQSGTRAARMALARFYFDSAQHDEAEALLARLLDENVIEAQALMARIALAQGNAPKADALIASVLANDPRNPDALVARSERSLASGKIDAAIEDANVVVSDAPQDYGGYAALANAHFAKGSKVRARQVFERGMNSLPQSKRLAARYEAFLRSVGDNGRVLSLYGDVASAKPSSIQAWNDFARVCQEFGNAICEMKIKRGLAAARTSFVIDEPPGTPRARGLFARITPEQICRSSGGVCTGG